MTDIYIIRHAEAEGNIYRRIDGHFNSRITANGYRQIEALQKRFENIRIDTVYASDLFRTCETAKALYVPKELPLHKDARFREAYFGDWEDVNFGWLERFAPEQMHNLNHDTDHWFPPKGETAAQFAQRFIDGLTENAARHDGQTIAVFTHGCVSGEAIRRLFGDAAKAAGRCDNTGVSLLHYENGNFSFSFLNDNSHLSAEISTLAHQLWWRGKHDFNLWFRPFAQEDIPLLELPFLPQKNSKKFTAVLVDRPVGYVSYDLMKNCVAVNALYLRPECRHIRMGDQLLGTAVVDGRAHGCKTLSVAVPDGNTEAEGLLRRFGAAAEKVSEALTAYTITINLPEY